MMNARYNAVIVGQTGVGKSTLINYLYGKKVTEEGVGKPVTKNGFHPINFEINGLPVCLFDSWGLEVGKHEEWLQDLDNEFKQRGVNESADKWFHSVFYCINAASARIQECDITIIKKFIAENYKVSVILTKADQISEEVEDILKKELQSQINGIHVTGVCSARTTTRVGTSQTFGKKDIERQAFNDFFDSLILRLPLRCKGVMERTLENWVEESKKKANDNAGFMGVNQRDIEVEIKDSAEQLQKNMQQLVSFEIKKTLDMYGFFAENLGYPSSEISNSVKNKSHFDFKKEELSVFTWLTIPLLILTPIIIVYVMFSGKSNAIEEMKIYIDKCEEEFKNIIDISIEDLTKILELVKLKATE